MFHFEKNMYFRSVIYWPAILAVQVLISTAAQNSNQVESSLPSLTQRRPSIASLSFSILPTKNESGHHSIKGPQRRSEKAAMEGSIFAVKKMVKTLSTYRARQKNGSQVARIFQARPGRSGKQQQEQNSRNLGTVFSPGPVLLHHTFSQSSELKSVLQF